MISIKWHAMLALLGVVLFLPACATVIRGPNAPFKVATEPPGATVTTDLVSKKTAREGNSVENGSPNFLGCTPTPCEFQVSRRSEFITTVTMEGYHPAVVEITSGLGQGGAGASATGAVVVAGSVYGAVYGMASLIPVMFGSTANAGAAAAATQTATGIGILFLGIDVASGAMLNVRPNPLVLILTPEAEPLPTDTYIDSEEELKELLAKRGVDISDNAD